MRQNVAHTNFHTGLTIYLIITNFIIVHSANLKDVSSSQVHVQY